MNIEYTATPYELNEKEFDVITHKIYREKQTSKPRNKSPIALFKTQTDVQMALMQTALGWKQPIDFR